MKYYLYELLHWNEIINNWNINKYAKIALDGKIC